ncbi:hypothetical protein [Nostoc sp. DedQUE09]|nr:hypothetical protein [Nostoc sp. DedQUE09]MDZ7953485.1 hypothetical protein [Nostoc sp. DedQUE09]
MPIQIPNIFQVLRFSGRYQALLANLSRSQEEKLKKRSPQSI